MRRKSPSSPRAWGPSMPRSGRSIRAALARPETGHPSTNRERPSGSGTSRAGLLSDWWHPAPAASQRPASRAAINRIGFPIIIFFLNGSSPQGFQSKGMENRVSTAPVRQSLKGSGVRNQGSVPTQVPLFRQAFIGIDIGIAIGIVFSHRSIPIPIPNSDSPLFRVRERLL